jgi:hypothetical protein
MINPPGLKQCASMSHFQLPNENYCSLSNNLIAISSQEWVDNARWIMLLM